MITDTLTYALLATTHFIVYANSKLHLAVVQLRAPIAKVELLQCR